MALTADELSLLSKLVESVRAISMRQIAMIKHIRGGSHPDTLDATTTLEADCTDLDAKLATVVAET